MIGRGTPARSNVRAVQGSVGIAHLDEFDASGLEQKRHPGDDITPAVLRLVARSLAEGRTVAILSRRNGIPWYVNWTTGAAAPTRGLQGFLDHLRSFLQPDQHERVTVSTAHRFKGLERDDVIVIDAVSRSYPLVHPDWIFGRVLGVTLDDLVAEDRRLFYVAVTRARNALYLITEPRSESPFLKGVRQQSFELAWSSYPPPTGIVGHIVLHVENRQGCKVPNDHGGFDQPTYAMRESLKLAGFRFVGSGGTRAWEKVVASEGFQFDRFIEQAWIREAIGIEIIAFDESGTTVNRWVAPDVSGENASLP
jgi:DNA helicase-4